jgi:lipopolysaccharide/colanic/teichoic acid biosynthesis glycosyltransferase
LLAPFITLTAGLIALAIYLDSPGPLIYRARRVGRDGQPFDMLKFRKMREGSAGGPLTLADDARFTPIGRFLAATRLDELPQVINVLRGQMRLVGPRPEDERFVAQHREAYREILLVPPGITGSAQLRFFDESVQLARADDAAAVYSRELLPRKIGIDIDYVRRRTLRHDLWILARTALLPVIVVSLALQRRQHLPALFPAAGAALLVCIAFVLSPGNVA